MKMEEEEFQERSDEDGKDPTMKMEEEFQERSDEDGKDPS